MREFAGRSFVWPALLVAALLLVPALLRASDDLVPAPNALAQTMLERARDELARIRPLVADGTLPKSRLAEAEAKVADAEDEAVLSGTLYGTTRLQDLTPEAASTMVDAARRRVERESVIAGEKRKLLDAGIISQSEFDAFSQELEGRQRVLDLARNRAHLVDDLRQMAETEKELEKAAERRLSLTGVMMRYNGAGQFSLSSLPLLSKRFAAQFHHPLPVSAIGETSVHRAMGLDHRNRVDVGLNPDQPEGIWFRKLLESLHIPYLAFRSAFPGAATAPHIHVGTGSSRLSS